MNLRSAILTHPGQKRPNNEDFVALFEPTDPETLEKSGCLYILADGVGGASNGELASRYAAQKILYDYYEYQDIPVEKRLKTIIRQTGNAIQDFAENQDTYMQMATTVVLAVVRNGTVQVAHVGDSRAYLLHHNEVTQLTRDHSTVGELMRDGVLTEDEAMHFEGRNPLSRSLGGERDVAVDVSEPILFQPEDKLLLTSDGFSRYASRADILGFLSHSTAQEAVGKMVDYANQCGGADNISVIVVETDGAPAMVPAGDSGGVPRPEPVDWETIHTLPSNYAEAKQRKKISNKRRVFLFGGVFFAMVGLGILAAILVIPRIFRGRTADETATAVQNIEETEAALIQTRTSFSFMQAGQVTPTETMTLTPIPSETVPSTPLPWASPGLNVDESVSSGGAVLVTEVTPTPDPPSTNTLEPGLEGITGYCIYEVDYTQLSDCENKPVSPLCVGNYSEPIDKVMSLDCLLQCKFPDIVASWDREDTILIDETPILRDYLDYILAMKWLNPPRSREDIQKSPLPIKHTQKLRLPEVTVVECEAAGGIFEPKE